MLRVSKSGDDGTKTVDLFEIEQTSVSPRQSANYGNPVSKLRNVISLNEDLSVDLLESVDYYYYQQLISQLTSGWTRLIDF